MLSRNQIENIFAIFLFLIPFGCFFFKKISIWEGTGLYIQIGILLLFSISLFNRSNKISVKNLPLGFLNFYLGISTLFIWYLALSLTGKFPVRVFLPYFNFLCYVIFYKLILEYADSQTIKKIFKYFPYSLLTLLFYCVLQFFSLDPFFKNASLPYGNDLIVGTLGNSSQLAGFLAITQPFFFNNALMLLFLWIILLLCKSASGIIVGLAVLLFYLFFTHKKAFFVLLSVSFIGLLIGFIRFNYFFDLSGRLEIWKRAYPLFQKNPFQGLGLGTFAALDFRDIGHETSRWLHLHLEYYQILLEAGIIGLLIVIWGIHEYFKTFFTVKKDLTIKIASIFFGFCLFCLISYPAHIWLLSSMGILSYSFMYIIKNEELNYAHTPGNQK